MVHVQQSLVLTAGARDVWAVVGNFDKINEWQPAVLTNETDDLEEGHVRVLGLLGGTKKMTERLVEKNDEAMSYSYIVIDGPLPVSDFTGHISVDPREEEEDGCIFTWSAEFEPKDTSEDDASAIITGYFAAGVASLKKMFANND